MAKSVLLFVFWTGAAILFNLYIYHASERMDHTGDTVRIVMIGKTGVGKSSTGNTIVGGADGSKPFKAAASSQTVTTECSAVYKTIDNRHVLLVDSPGLFDTEHDHDYTAKKIGKFVGLTSPGPHAFLFVTRIGRFTKEDQEVVNSFRDILGEKMFDFMIVVFTGYDDLINEGQSPEEYIGNLQTELKDLLKRAGNRYVFINNRSDKIITQRQPLLALVDELVRANNHSCYTNEKYQEAERFLKEKREQVRLANELQKRKEEERITREMKEKYQAKVERINSQYASETETSRREINELKDIIEQERQLRMQDISDRYETNTANGIEIFLKELAFALILDGFIRPQFKNLYSHDEF